MEMEENSIAKLFHLPKPILKLDLTIISLALNGAVNPTKKIGVNVLMKLGIMGILLEHLVNKYDLDLKGVHAIGFSYGTHVIGENIVFKHFVLDCQNIKFYRKEAALTMLPRKL